MSVFVIIQRMLMLLAMMALGYISYKKDWLDHHLMQAQKGIRFIDSHYNDKFRLPDGGKIQITLPSGEKLTETCRYIDEYHVEVGRWLYHICEFAERMEKNGNTVEPLTPPLEKNNKKRKERQNAGIDR